MGRRVYDAIFNSGTIATSGTTDIFSAKSPALSGCQVHHIQLSAGGVTTAAEVSLTLKRATAVLTLASVGGSAITPVPVDASDGACGTTAFQFGTTPATTSGAFTDVAYFQWNVLLPFDYMPGPEDEDRETCLAGGAGFVLATITQPTPAVTASGLFKFREVP